MITFEEIKQNKTINTYITEADKSLLAMGYTEHSFAHVCKVANDAAYILTKLNRPEREIELVKIAGYLHDIGNVVNRADHPHSGAIMSFKILSDLNMDTKEIAQIISAIGNHDESTGGAFDVCSAAVIIADKTDVRRNRVLERDSNQFDIHDRVNYAVTKAELDIDTDKKQIVLNLDVDESICTMYEYFDIFLGRMQMCRHAAEILGTRFRLMVNGVKIL